MRIKERAEWAPIGTLSTYPLGSGRTAIWATCNICDLAWRRRTYKGARRTLHRHWTAIKQSPSAASRGAGVPQRSGEPPRSTLESTATDPTSRHPHP